MTISHRARHAGAAAVGRVLAAGTLAVALMGGAAYGGSLVLSGRSDRGGAATPAAALPAAIEGVPGEQPAEAAVPATTDPPPTSPAPAASPTPAATPATTATAPPTQPTQPTQRRTTTAPAAASGPVAEVFRLVNAERANAGCPAVTADSRLASAAQAHSADMAANDYFSHTGRDGSTLGSRITAAGYPWSSVGENIAKGQPTPAAVMQAWMDSPGHRANILNCRFRNLGVGLAYDGRSPVWTQDFGTLG